MTAHLQPLLDAARNKLQNVAATNVPIYLFATQGMRDLDITEPVTSKSILGFVHQAFQDIGNENDGNTFRIGGTPNGDHPNRSARIIQGNAEGLLAWVALNDGYGGDAPVMRGIYEMGGASLQIAYDNDVEPEGNPGHIKKVCVEAGEKWVYSRSWKFGSDSIWRMLLESLKSAYPSGDIQNPCLRNGVNLDLGGRNYIGTGVWNTYVFYLFLRLFLMPYSLTAAMLI